MNVTSIITVGYENKSPIWAPKKQSQISKRQKPMQTSLPKGIMKNTALSASKKQTQNKPNLSRRSLWRSRIRANIMLPRMKINNRPNSLAHYPDCRFFAADLGPNLSCFIGLLFALGLIFSEKKQQIPQIPDKAGARLCRFVYIKKTLVFLSGARDNNCRFSIKIEDKHW